MSDRCVSFSDDGDQVPLSDGATLVVRDGELYYEDGESVPHRIFAPRQPEKWVIRDVCEQSHLVCVWLACHGISYLRDRRISMIIFNTETRKRSRLILTSFDSRDKYAPANLFMRGNYIITHVRHELTVSEIRRIDGRLQIIPLCNLLDRHLGFEIPTNFRLGTFPEFNVVWGGEQYHCTIVKTDSHDVWADPYTFKSTKLDLNAQVDLL